MTENVWDNKVVSDAALRIKEKHEIVFGEDLIPTDRDLIDRLFRAGVDMLVSTGIFNVDSGKVINVTEDEVMAAIRNAPKRIQLGANKDMVL
ncbi:MAG TPA: monomethylamine:corrinoid methyltransferase, partial [Methanomassiliicoccaceae archaeon]|nr:monomethylamine:corrinoid methyltransferase [Methanomassiliicoccaceae archaeon]